ncbi:MAG: hypothetical protein IJA26_03760 [Clostridia bacterium]|nr:hypothetical protein [Clostridia bacterium]
MPIDKKFDVSERKARLNMQEASRKAEEELEFQDMLNDPAKDEKFVRTYRVRGKLYDKFNFSLKTMDIIIFTVSALIIAALVIGIVIGN